jgi:hypothetical protein
MTEYQGRTIVGLTEKVIIKGEHETKELIARIDTGATKSSIDLALADKLGLGPVVDSKLIKSAHGVKLRPVVQAEVILGGKTILARFTLADRNHMKYDVLIGQNILKKNFLVDPGLSVELLEKEQQKKEKGDAVAKSSDN